MKCKHCKNEIPDNSIFCLYCGERVVKERKKKDEVKVPKPRQLKSGKWNIQLRAEGQSITEDTAELCVIKAQAIRSKFLQGKSSSPGITLTQAIDKYIADRSNILSPSTIRGYRMIQKHRFQSVMNKEVGSVTNWQAVVNAEAELCSAKTLRNSWLFLKTVHSTCGIKLPNVALPQIIRRELPWLDYTQLVAFLEVIRDEPCELAALLALHSLRRSEVLAVTPNKIKDGYIYVEGSSVFDEDNVLVAKETNKNTTSRRKVKIVIPRLSELVENYDGAPDEPFVKCYANTLREQINRLCEENNLPKVGVHGLRRSFASLAHHLGWSEHSVMQAGGWSDYEVVHEIYTKLSQADATADYEKMENYYSAQQPTSR